MRTENRVKGFANNAGTGINAAAAAFRTGSASAAGGLGQIRASLDTATQRLPGFSLAAGVAMGAVGAMTSALTSKLEGLTSKITGAVSTMAALGPAAARLGVTTGALAGLQHGAALAGVGADELEAHFTRFQKALSESAIGTGEARLAFAQLGLQVESMKDLDPVEAFGKFADALSRTGTAADKIRLVDAVMGRGGDRLIPLLSQGAEGIRKMTEEAAMLGPTSAASVAKVAESALSWRRVEEAVSGLGRTIAVELAPTFVSASRGSRASCPPSASWTSTARRSRSCAGGRLRVGGGPGDRQPGRGGNRGSGGRWRDLDLLPTRWDTIRDSGVMAVFAWRRPGRIWGI